MPHHRVLVADVATLQCHMSTTIMWCLEPDLSHRRYFCTTYIFKENILAMILIIICITRLMKFMNPDACKK